MYTEDIKSCCSRLISSVKKSKEDLRAHSGVMTVENNNVVELDKLREVQLQTLDKLKDFLQYTFGPMGSNTMILRGNNSENIVAEYSKDGHKVLQSIKFENPIEMAIQSLMVDITHHVEHEVGDGTTSAVQLSALIFSYLNEIMKDNSNVPPYNVIRSFKEVISRIQDRILEKKRDVTLDDIFDICMISTNGDEAISQEIASIYEKYGFNVRIETGISNDTESKLKIYDGCTMNCGYADIGYVNRKDIGVSEIHNARIYAFEDPVDTPEMISLFEKIVKSNIIDPVNEEEDPIPTVIMAPKFSRDLGSMFRNILDVLYQFDARNMSNQKPPLLVVTNIVGADEGIYYDLTQLCGCPMIRKYIDPTVQAKDIEMGRAATLETVCNFYGEAELVVADKEKTKFVNPKLMHTENGEPSGTYNMLLDFLESELASAKENNESLGVIATYKRRISSLKANMVEYLVGGISIADRDSKRDLIIDAVKNCSSACEHGVGNAANFEGLKASIEELDRLLHTAGATDTLEFEITKAVMLAYYEVSRTLYSSVESGEKVDEIINNSLEYGSPMNLYTRDFSGVLCSIMLDVKILEAISKIVIESILR